MLRSCEFYVPIQDNENYCNFQIKLILIVRDADEIWAKLNIPALIFIARGSERPDSP